MKKPKATVVITHHNYSDHVAGAIDSVLNQTYEDVDCIVVDDSSDPEHRRNLRVIFESRRCDRLRLICNETNIGQIPAFYVGVDNTDADFVCLLDPDDRYFPTFISETIEAHLNPYVVVPIVCSEQVFSSRGRQLTGVFLSDSHNDMLYQGIELEQGKRYTLRLYGWESKGVAVDQHQLHDVPAARARAHEADAGARIQGVRRCLSWARGAIPRRDLVS